MQESPQPWKQRLPLPPSLIVKMEREEKRNKRTGFFVSLGVHLGLLVLFIFLLAWKEPYPPLPEYGIELNFGLDAQGAGEVESEQTSQEELVEEQEEVQEESEEATDNEDQEESEPEEAEEISEEIEAESVEESTSEVSATDAAVSEKKVEVEDPEEEKKEEKVEKKEEPKVLVTYKAGGQSEGNTEDSGNMGDPSGNEDSKNYEGILGGGGGAVLDLSGWKWEKAPVPDDKSDAKGRIVFQITVDRYGKVTRIKTVEKTVSPIVEKIYREEVLKTRFVKTGSGMAAEESVGKITFVIKSS